MKHWFMIILGSISLIHGDGDTNSNRMENKINKENKPFFKIFGFFLYSKHFIVKYKNEIGFLELYSIYYRIHNCSTMRLTIKTLIGT